VTSQDFPSLKGRRRGHACGAVQGMAAPCVAAPRCWFQAGLRILIYGPRLGRPQTEARGHQRAVRAPNKNRFPDSRTRKTGARVRGGWSVAAPQAAVALALSVRSWSWQPSPRHEVASADLRRLGLADGGRLRRLGRRAGIARAEGLLTKPGAGKRWLVGRRRRKAYVAVGIRAGPGGPTRWAPGRGLSPRWAD